MNEHTEFQLDEHEAFTAMSLFLNQFVERAGDNLVTLLVDIMILEDGLTSDPAAWHDWLKCVRAVKGEGDEPAEEATSDE
jgi:hypothetical protein